jgi:hypothetical protein
MERQRKLLVRGKFERFVSRRQEAESMRGLINPAPLICTGALPPQQTGPRASRCNFLFAQFAD